ncbi:hypothetical protein CBS101457_006760 [Exobasidium rhododendri]|nr:hypothetical protein CBS101457_006760 [Exobasidium rhododendri]
MASLVKELLADSKSNFLLLFKKQPKESVTFVHQNGSEQTVIEPTLKVKNPVQILRSVPALQWLYFSCGFLTLLSEMLDLYLVIIQTQRISVYYHTTPSEVSKAYVYAAFVRVLGAIVSGMVADYIGRKYPMLINLTLLTLLQIATIHCTTIGSFIGVRTLAGFPMGGLWGSAAAMAMDGCPIEARGLMSGLYASAGPLAYVLASCIILSFGLESSAWKATFWVSVGLSTFALIVRLLVPESRSGVKLVTAGQGQAPPLKGMAKVKHYLQDLKLAMKTSWKRFIYMILIVTTVWTALQVAYSCYTTFLITARGMNIKVASRINIATKMGGFLGTILAGTASEFTGRRRMMLLSCLVVLVLIPAYILPTSFGGLIAGGFFFNLFFDGNLALLPVHLNELSPAAYRALLPGLAHQLGGLFSSGAQVFVNELAQAYHDTFHGKVVPAYGSVIMILAAISLGQLIQLIAVGPENHGGHFEEAGESVEDKRATFYSTPIPMTTLSYGKHGSDSDSDSMTDARMDEKYKNGYSWS